MTLAKVLGPGHVRGCHDRGGGGKSLCCFKVFFLLFRGLRSFFKLTRTRFHLVNEFLIRGFQDWSGDRTDDVLVAHEVDVLVQAEHFGIFVEPGNPAAATIAHPALAVGGEDQICSGKKKV